MTRILSRADLPFPGTATALLPGLLPGINACTVKVNAKFPTARPALRGVICLHGDHPGRTHPAQRTVYAPVGLPWQDLALSWLAYQEAERHAIGLHIDLLADPST